MTIGNSPQDFAVFLQIAVNGLRGESPLYQATFEMFPEKSLCHSGVHSIFNRIKV
jgi:hypothetical protein